MAKYKRNPLVVDAAVYEEYQGMEDGIVVYLVNMKEEEHYTKILSGKNCWKAYYKLISDITDNPHVTIDRPAKTYINTYEGRRFISNGDYIVTGTLGERYICHPEIFKEGYTLVE